MELNIELATVMEQLVNTLRLPVEVQLDTVLQFIRSNKPISLKEYIRVEWVLRKIGQLESDIVAERLIIKQLKSSLPVAEKLEAGKLGVRIGVEKEVVSITIEWVVHTKAGVDIAVGEGMEYFVAINITKVRVPVELVLNHIIAVGWKLVIFEQAISSSLDINSKPDMVKPIQK